MRKRFLPSGKRGGWLAAVFGLCLGLGFFLFLVVFPAISFIGKTTGGGRVSSYLPDTPAPLPTPSLLAYDQSILIQPTPTAQASTLDPTTPPLTINNQATTPTPIPAYTTAGLVQKLKTNQPVSLLIVGYGGNGHAGQWLTDSIMVLRYEPKSKTILQFSIPRDLCVLAPYGGSAKNKTRTVKINTIVASIMEWSEPNQANLDPKYRWNNDKDKFDRGVNLLADTVEQVLGFGIDEWATLSFEGFRQLIDAMGGIEVNVPRYFIDHQYPRNDNDQIDASYMTIEFFPGVQQLNGERAIQYARSRHSETPLEGSDFARSRRQMQIINAVKTQIFQKDLVLKALSYMQALEGRVRFSLDFGELSALAGYFNSEEGKKLAGQIKFSAEVLDNTLVTDTTVAGDYALLPVEGLGKYNAIHSWVQNRLNNADLRGEEVRVQVLNASGGQSGIATKVSNFLVGQGFRLGESQDAPDQAETELLDYSQGAAPRTIARLKQYLPYLKVTELPPEKRPKELAAEIGMQLVLGKNFKGVVLPS